MRRLALVLAAATVGLALAVPAHAKTCTAAEKQKAQAALAAYRKAMPKQRAAFFKRHKHAKQRKTFVRKQQTKLKRLKAAAACTVASAPPPPAPPPAPPLDTTPPHLGSATVDASVVAVTFDEDVTLDDSSFAVYVNGGAVIPQSGAASGMTVALTLPGAVGGDDIVRLDYARGVKDAAGNAAAPVSGVVVANATPAPCSFMVSGPSSTGPQQHEGPIDLSLFRSSLGELHGIVLWLDFPDAAATESIPTLSEQLVPPAADAYASMSYGRFALKIDAASRWYRLPQTSTYYGLNAADGAGRKDEYIAAAVNAADADIDFSHYDVVYLVASAGASADMTTATQRYPGMPLAVADGTEIRHAVLLGTDRLQEARHGSEGVIHETGHVLGLPDLYGDPTAVGGWDPMSFNLFPGAELMGWHRWKLKWLDPAQLRCVQPGRTVQATLSPLETPGGVKLIVAPLSATRALVVENRQAIGLDARLCDKGVLVYTVDGAVTFPGAPIRVLPAHPGTDTDQALQQRCGPRYDAPLDLGADEVSSLVDAASGVRVDVVSAADGNYVVRVGR